MDRRLTFSNGTVADIALQGVVQAETYVAPKPMAVAVPLVDMVHGVEGPRDKQLLYGAHVMGIELGNGWVLVQDPTDGFVGHVVAQALSAADTVTHKVVSKATHVYSKADFKSSEVFALPYGASLYVLHDADRFFAVAQGFVPKQHCAPVAERRTDPVAVAEAFLGTPYLWGGNSCWGIDCSGLVQTVLHAAGLQCQRDSDQQQATLGKDLAPDATLVRGDVVFWKGHVGLMRDAETLIHANAHHMAVASEPLAKAEARILANEFGPIVARKRVL